MAKRKPTIAKSADDLTKILGIKTADAHEWEFQLTLLQKLRVAVTKLGLTHVQVAERAGTSRTRVTAILNGNLQNVSSDLLIRILGSLGYSVRVQVVKGRVAA
jgi:predicted XRE-type DNA-binding protein